jgi:hypothetical protein
MLRTSIFLTRMARRISMAAALVGGLMALSDVAKASAVNLNLNALPGPGQLSATGFADINGASALATYSVAGGKPLSFFNATSATNDIQWNFSFSLGSHFPGGAHLDLILTDFDLGAGSALATSDFTITGSGITNLVTKFVAGHPDELELLADLPISTTNIYDLVVNGMNNNGNTHFGIVGQVPIPGTITLFVSALFGLGILKMSSRRKGTSFSADLPGSAAI